jgi:hypothetical protein
MFLLLLTFAKLANGNTTRTLRRLNHGGCTRTLVEAPFAKGTCFRRKTAQRSGRAERLHHRVEPVGFKWSCTRLSSTWSENRRAREMVHCGTKATSIPCRSRRGVRPSGGGGGTSSRLRARTRQYQLPPMLATQRASENAENTTVVKMMDLVARQSAKHDYGHNLFWHASRNFSCDVDTSTTYQSVV